MRAPLNGRAAPRDTVGERVCARVKTLADAYPVRTRKRAGDLVGAVHRELGISEVWARELLMEKYGVVRTGLRGHGSVTPAQHERLPAGVVRSVVPTKAPHDER
ncbi:hypothetical protein AB0L74_29085 [Streptomyces sp. NPDC052020]|uniref:hypothetical protein n=1 Tax=Streptomyces sp. NPDC052020 TaxID=3155677 RepID=UPI003443A488